MAYVTYDYYTDQYFGTLLTREEFFKYVKKACAEIDRITFGRLWNLNDNEIPDCVRDAACDAAEKMKEYDSSGSGRIASESNDGFSVSYREADAQKREILLGMRTYLANTGLLCRGVPHKEWR